MPLNTIPLAIPIEWVSHDHHSKGLEPRGQCFVLQTTTGGSHSGSHSSLQEASSKARGYESWLPPAPIGSNSGSHCFAQEASSKTPGYEIWLQPAPTGSHSGSHCFSQEASSKTQDYEIRLPPAPTPAPTLSAGSSKRNTNLRAPPHLLFILLNYRRGNPKSDLLASFCGSPF